MCDYSLCGLPNRLATDGEQLVVHRFPTGSMGLASAVDVKCLEQSQKPRRPSGLWGQIKSLFEGDLQPLVPPAVCIPPGSLLIMRNISPMIQERYGVQREEGVVFVQTSANSNQHRDGVEFTNGRQALLQEFPEGVQAEVLSVSGNAVPVHEERDLVGASMNRRSPR